MSYPPSTLQYTEEIGQGIIGLESQQQSPHTASIHILDDDSLLNVFYLHRPFLFREDDDDEDRLTGGKRGWDHELWWYRLAQVCQRWRNLILGSASYLGLCLVCTYGTPVADMLAHSPPLPLVIDFNDEDRDITADEEGIVLALEQRDRVRRIRLYMPGPDLQEIIMAIDEEYPILEYLIMGESRQILQGNSALTLSETFQAPHLRHLTLINFALPMGSRLLTTAVGLVTLGLLLEHPSTYIRPNTLLQWLSSMPQLETLVIIFSFPVINRGVERQLTHAPIMTHVTLPNLRQFWFLGVSAYLEEIFRRITTPRLEKLLIDFFNQLTFSIPRLLQFMSTTENLRFDRVEFSFFRKRVYVEVYPPEEDKTYALRITIICYHLDWQVSSVAQIFDALSQIFFAVEHLTFDHEVHSQSSEEHNEVDRTEWRKLLRPFSNVKTLRVNDELMEELSHCLRIDDGELPLELLPELQELTYSGNGNASGVFASFIDARQNAGRPVTLVRRSPMSSSPEPSLEASAITSAPSGGTGNDFDT